MRKGGRHTSRLRTRGEDKGSSSSFGRSKQEEAGRWRAKRGGVKGGEEERRAGTLATVAVAKEQMALRGAATVAAPGHRPQCRAQLNESHTCSGHTKTLNYPTVLLFSSTSSFSIHQSIFHSLCPHSWLELNNVTKSIYTLSAFSFSSFHSHSLCLCLRVSVPVPWSFQLAPTKTLGRSAGVGEWPMTLSEKTGVCQLPLSLWRESYERGAEDEMKREVTVLQVVPEDVDVCERVWWRLSALLG